jgi:hypothetical protein
MLGEESRPLRERVAADQFEGSAWWNSLGSSSKLGSPLGVGTRRPHGRKKCFRSAKLLDRRKLSRNRRGLRRVTADGRKEFAFVTVGFVEKPRGFAEL